MSRGRSAARVLAIPALLAVVTLAALVGALVLGGNGAVVVGLWLFVPLLATLTGPPAAVVLVVGARALWRRREVRWVAVAAGLHLLLALVTGGKPYYLLPWVPVLAAAAVPVLRGWAARSRGRRRLRVGLLAVGAVSSVVIALPVLPPRLAPVA